MESENIPKEKLAKLVSDPDWKKVWDLDKAIEVFIEIRDHFRQKTRENISGKRIEIASIRGVRSRIKKIQSKKDLRSEKHYNRWYEIKKIERKNIVEKRHPDSKFWKISCEKRFRPKYVKCDFAGATENPTEWIECPECGTYPLKIIPSKSGNS